MKERFPQFLHLPIQVLWFDSNEILIIVGFYLGAMMFGTAGWVALFIGAPLVIGYKRKQARGFFNHVLYFLGFRELRGYPNPHVDKFHE